MKLDTVKPEHAAVDNSNDVNHGGSPRGAVIPIIFLLFLATGMSGLIYQVVWQRLLLTVFGATIYSVSTVLAAFMGGLALGSWLFGRRSERMRNLLGAYGVLEIGVGVLALLVPLALRVMDPLFAAAYRAFGSNFLAYSIVRFVFVFAILLVPTTLMGATIPLLSKYLSPGGRAAGRWVGALYTVNTAGAVLGTFLSGFFLIRWWGISRTTWLAAGMNIFAGLIAILMSRIGSGRAGILPAIGSADLKKGGAGELINKPLPEVAGRMPALQRTVRWVLIAYLISGFAALGLEVAWTRSLVFTFGALKNTTYSFTAMLAVFLIGITAGSAVMTPFADRHAEPVRLFAGLMALTGLLSIFSFFVLYYKGYYIGAEALPEFDSRGVLRWWNAVGQVFLKSAAVVLPPTFCMGLAFPAAVRAVTVGSSAVGRDVGRLYALNTVGAIFGAVAVGFVLLPAVGIAHTIWLLGGIQMVAGTAILMRSGSLAPDAEVEPVSGRQDAGPTKGGGTTNKEMGWVWAVLTVAVIGVALWRIPRPATFQRLESTEHTVFYKEGPFATVSVVENSLGFRTIYVDNVGVAGTDPMLLTDQKSLAHVPMLLLEKPKKALTVGFGSGGASYSYTLYPELDQIDCVEITKTVPEASPWLVDSNHGVIYRASQAAALEKPPQVMRLELDGSRTPLPQAPAEPLVPLGKDWKKSDIRYNIVLDDARSYLRFTPTHYDIIATDCTDLRYKSNANLYDREYFQLCRDNITDDGMVCVWMPLGGLSPAAMRVALRTFFVVFPEMEVFYMNNQPTHYVLLVGTKKPLKVNLARMAERLRANPGISKDLGEIYLNNAEKLLSCFILGRGKMDQYLGAGPLNTEDFPYLEFESPRYGYGDKPLLDNLEDMMKYREEPTRLVAEESRSGVSPLSTSATSSATALRRYFDAVPEIIRGHHEYRENKVVDAAREYMAALKKNPDDAAVKALLDMDELRRKSRGQEGFGGFWAQVKLGEILAMQGRDSEAVTELNAALERQVPAANEQARIDIAAQTKLALSLLADLYKKAGNATKADELRQRSGSIGVK